MFSRTKYTMLEKIFICSVIMLHLTLILPLSEVFPLPKALTKPEVFAEELPNNPPVIEEMSPITKDEGQTIVLEPAAYDPDGDPVTVIYEAPFDTNGSWEIPYDYTAPDPTKSFTTKITASDGALESFITVNITVNNVNVAPAVDITSSSYCVNPNTDFTLYITANDEDGDTLTYEIKENDTVIPISETTRNLPTGLYKYIITVTDPSLETATDSCYVEVIDTTPGEDEVYPISGDFNGDGLTDIGIFTRTTGDWKVSVSNNGVFDNVQLWKSNLKGDNIERTYSVTGDFDGDGLTDIGLFDTDGGKWKFARSNGESFVDENSWNVTRFGIGDCSPLVGDYNADGYTDIGYSQIRNGSERFWIKLAKQDGMGFEKAVVSHLSSLNNSRAYAGDFDGDSMPDVLVFEESSGEWHVALTNDVESSEVVNWAADANSTVTGDTGGAGGNLSGAKENIFDEDDTTYWSYGAGAANPYGIIEMDFDLWAQSEFAASHSITRMRAKIYGRGYIGGVTYDIQVYDGGTWKSVTSGSQGDILDVTIDETDLTYESVTKVKITTHAHGVSPQPGAPCIAGITLLELSAWGPDNSGEANGELYALSGGESWVAAGFGADKDLILTDYNHDGKTDIGYFDERTREWYYALSDGTQFNEVSGANWPSPFPVKQEADILPSGGDFNGDGIGDAAIFRRTAYGVLNKWEIKLHNSRQPDLLAVVNNGIGGTTNIEYEVSTQFDNTGGDGQSDLPFPISVVKKVTKSDGMDNSYEINYEYQDGLFDADTREFRGFKYVKVVDSEGTVKETEFHQLDERKGRIKEEVVSDIYERTYSCVQYEWDKVKRYSDSVAVPYLVSKTSTLYNFKDGTTKDIKTTYDIPDGYGNICRIDELGFVANSDFADDPTDDRYTEIQYENNPDLINKYIVGKPKRTMIKKGDAIVSDTWYTYDSYYGSLKTETKSLDTGDDPVTTFEYDYEVPGQPPCGNLVGVIDARGYKTSTEYSLDYAYTFPVQVANTLGHTQSFTYDYKTGQILTSTDPNGQITTTLYDGFGRIQKIIGPNDTIDSPGIEYFYDLNSRPIKITTVTKVDIDEFVTSYAFLDGLGRTIEVKTEAEKPSEQLLSGIVKYDERGQIKEKYLPYIVPSSGNYVAPNYAQLKISYEYDPIGRVTKTTGPDKVSSCVQYDGWIVTAIDGNGHKLQSEKDAFGRLIKVTEYNGAETYITQYKYDALGNLEETIDAQDNKTIIKYDSLGRKISMNDPDMGEWSYEYDAVGNLKKQTDAKGQTINFQYDGINRLVEKSGLSPQGTVPDFSVTYAYDTVTLDNPYAKGRLTKVTDPSGTTEFFYDNLGREIKTVKGLSPQGTVPTEYYTVERTYDSIDRLKTVTYPDGEVITYAYNVAGGIETIKGLSPQGTVPYVTNVDYNEYGQMIRVDYGNGTYTTYKYDDYNFRLENLQTNNGQTVIQNLSYTFDNVGNVLSIKDDVSPTNSQSFGYDDLNRLTNATSGTGGYGNITYAYNSIGNMTSRTSLRGAEGDEAISYAYGEGTAGPHAVTSYTLSDNRYTLAYDANGNMTQKEYEGGVKNFIYDIENRLIEVGIPKERQVQDYTIELNPGWNFVSIPVKPIGAQAFDIANLLKSSSISKAQVSRYNSAIQSWENFAYESEKDLTEYCDFTDFEYGKGYEIYVESNCTLTISGITPLSTQTLELYPGWNLIAAPTAKDPIPVKEALSGITYEEVVAASSLRGIEDAEAISYNPVTALETGNSYYVKVLNQRTWNIPREQDKTTFVYDGDGGRVKKISSDETVTYIGSSYEVTTGTVPEGGLSRIKKHIFLGSTRICTVEGTVPEGGLSPETWDYHYFHPDHIGSSNVITDGSGNVARIYEYTPYGLTAGEPRDYTYNTDYRFTGKLFDTDTGLYYYGARYYDPELGRFIQPDTIVPYPDDPQSFNRYAYARNNPIRYVDPTGHSWKEWIGHIIGAVAGIFITAISGGNAWLGLQTYSFWSGAINSAISGNWGGFAGGMAGSIVGGALGIGAASGIYKAFGESAFSFGAGFLGGAAEFGLSGFGVGFGSTLGAGGSFNDALQSGLIAGGVSAVAGGIIQGSYLAGWQNQLHGTDRRQVYESAIKQLRAKSLRNMANIPGDRIQITAGSRPVSGTDLRHRFTRGGPGGAFEMGPDATSGLIEINGENSLAETDRYLAESIERVITTNVEVSKSGFIAAQRIYTAAWTDVPYHASYCNSNYAINTLIYGAGGNIPENLGATPQFKSEFFKPD